MTLETAKIRLRAMTQSIIEPTLTEDEITALLGMFALEDASGNAPNAAAWQYRYDFNGAAAEGWRWKAAKVSNQHTVVVDGQQFQPNQKFEACQQMASRYEKKRVFSVSSANPQ
jgi:hypothetical protein